MSSEHQNYRSLSSFELSPSKNRLSVCLSVHVLTLYKAAFQHDGAPAHKTSSVKQYLVEEFGEQIIGYGGFQEWPPSSPDLTPIDFFLWGYLKQQVYATPPPTLQEIQRRITDAFTNVTPSRLHRAQREVQASVQMRIAADGEKFEHRK
ncbi:hypothetical protein AVEN_211067-1 [Araneus ventricosus]|uniref:Tc1-like transposase DDE domain-containing protein n=1 Tax=Araneus ventricosus TaxID=182803 RepID=A0A4Y2U0A4_ARAVE|nr:hypothetical protein AVEN_211067-1 [Araneus ventricosus]